MALRLKSDLPESARSLAAASVIGTLRGGSGFSPESIPKAGSIPGDLKATRSASVAQPFGAYECTASLAVDDVVGGAERVGWRHMVFSADELAGSSDIALEKDGSTKTVGSREEPPDLLEALEVISDLEVVREEDFELRFLEVPGAAIAAWWLHSETGEAKNLFVPVPPSARSLLASYSEPLDQGTFQERVAGVARERLEASADFLNAQQTSWLDGELSE